MLELLINGLLLGAAFLGATVVKQLVKYAVKKKMTEKEVIKIKLRLHGREIQVTEDQLNKLWKLQYLYGLRDAKLRDKTKTYPKLRRVK
jgi:hypothetical protein